MSNLYSSFECSRRQVKSGGLGDTARRRTGTEGGGGVDPGGVFEVDLHPHALSQTDALPVVLVSAERCGRDGVGKMLGRQEMDL